MPHPWVLNLTLGASLGSAQPAEPEGWMLCSRIDGPLPAGWQAAPNLLQHRTPADIFGESRPTTYEAAARQLVELVQARPELLAQPGNWLRLDQIAWPPVAECETCQPPVDPHAPREADPILALTAEAGRFRAAVLEALDGLPIRPYAVLDYPVAPRSGPPGPPVPMLSAGPRASSVVDGGFLPGLPAPPEWPAGGGPRDVLARRTRYLLLNRQPTWIEAYLLVDDGFGENFGLPLCGERLAARLAEARQHGQRPAVVRRPSQFAARGPAWLTERMRAVADGATDPLGDPFRLDDPELARALDLYAPLLPRLQDRPYEVAAALVEAVATLAAFDRGEASAEQVRQAWAVDFGRVGLELARRVGALQELRLARDRIVLPAAPAIKLDGLLAAGEWRGARQTSLRLGADGRPTARPAEAWLARDGGDLLLAVSATEPDPSEATSGDRLLLWLAPDGGPAVRLSVTVGGAVEAHRSAGGSVVPVAAPAVRSQALFDGPGWTMELRLPLPPGDGWALNLATEHRRGYQSATTWWRFPAGLSWSPARYVALR